jgi:hypothetical protein
MGVGERQHLRRRVVLVVRDFAKQVLRSSDGDVVRAADQLVETLSNPIPESLMTTWDDRRMVANRNNLSVRSDCLIGLESVGLLVESRLVTLAGRPREDSGIALGTVVVLKDLE